jgi:hypothetical protein
MESLLRVSAGDEQGVTAVVLLSILGSGDVGSDGFEDKLLARSVEPGAASVKPLMWLQPTERSEKRTARLATEEAPRRGVISRSPETRWYPAQTDRSRRDETFFLMALAD